MLYTVLGVLSNFFILLSLGGIWIQLRVVLRRKRYFRGAGERRQRPTDVLSLNHFVVRFIAFCAIVAYGFSLRPFNHFLVWSHLAAAAILYAIILEIYTDRRDGVSAVIFLICTAIFLLGLVAWLIGDPARSCTKAVAEFILLFMVVFIAQSDIHQMYLVRRSGNVGAVSLRTHQTTVIKDLSVVAFGLVMGIGTGWPVIVSAGTSAVTKSLILWHFRWVRRR